MITVSQINYIAGVLEGEGNFGSSQNTVTISLGMTDRDIVDRIGSIMCPKSLIYKQSFTAFSKSNNIRPMYHMKISGFLAIQWMMTLYSLMGERRKKQILAAIIKWEENKYIGAKGRDNPATCGHPMKIIGSHFKWSYRNGSAVKICVFCEKERQRRYRHRKLAGLVGV